MRYYQLGVVLTLLYKQEDWGNVPYHVDHIFPSSKLQVEDPIEVGFEPRKANELSDKGDKLANLQLLTARENESKKAKSFEQWVKKQDDSFFERHFIPPEPRYHKLENFDVFLDRRKEMIVDHLLDILG